MQMSDANSTGHLPESSRSQPGHRFFARLRSFDLSCPRCNTVDSVSALRPWWKRKANFNPWRSRWECRSCRKVFAVGVVLWPVSRAGNRPREDRPIDTIPTKQELLGLQLAVERGWTDAVNVVACECIGTDSTACALHAPGSDAGP
jgi:hypothetical protein